MDDMTLSNNKSVRVVENIKIFCSEVQKHLFVSNKESVCVLSFLRAR